MMDIVQIKAWAVIKRPAEGEEFTIEGVFTEEEFADLHITIQKKKYKGELSAIVWEKRETVINTLK